MYSLEALLHKCIFIPLPPYAAISSTTFLMKYIQYFRGIFLKMFFFALYLTAVLYFIYLFA